MRSGKARTLQACRVVASVEEYKEHLGLLSRFPSWGKASLSVLCVVASADECKGLGSVVLFRSVKDAVQIVSAKGEFVVAL